MSINGITVIKRQEQITGEGIRLSNGKTNSLPIKESVLEGAAFDERFSLKAQNGDNKIEDLFNRKLQFQINKELNRIIIKVIDTDTEKIIREIPSEDAQKLQIRMRETAGLLFDKTI